MTDLREDEKRFLDNLLNSLIQYCQRAEVRQEVIYPILESNLDILTVDFAKRLYDWGSLKIRQSSPNSSQIIATCLSWLSELLLYFPLGDKIANIAIAKAGYECSLTFYTKDKNPFAWAEIQINLGIASEEDVQADPVQKWEEAITYYQKASQVFTREVNTERWASIQENLGNAYRNREEGKVEINLQQAITFYQNALEFFNPDQHPKQWGMTQYNFGQVYFKLSTLNIKESSLDYEQCLQTAITHYEQALQTLTKDVYPDLWALSHMSLGNAYSYRLRGNPYQNYEKAQKYYENALLVYTHQTYPFYYQMVKESQQRVQELIQVLSESESNEEYREDFSFISKTLNIILASEGDVQKVLDFLEKNLDQLNQDLPSKISAFISVLVKTKSQQLPIFMEAIAQLSALMCIFPGGNREFNLNIAITGWYLVSSLLSQSSNFSSEVSQVLGMMKLQLARAFYEKFEKRLGDIDIINLEESIKCFEEGFGILNYENAPEKDFWEDCQKTLGIAYHQRYEIKGDLNDIEKSIEACKLALTSGQENSSWWADVQMKLGNAYCDRQGDSLQNLNLGISYYEKSLKVHKKDTYPQKWADVQINLGQAYYHRGTLGHPNCAEDFELAIQSYNNALNIYNDSSTILWAKLKNALGVVYSDRRKGNYADNLESAINYFNESLKLITRNSYPYEWGRIQKNLGAIYLQRKQGGRGDAVTNLQTGIKCCEGALQVFTVKKYPVDYAETQANLSILYRILAEFIEPKENLKKAISYATNAETLFRNQPHKWARSQYELGILYKNLGVFAKENTKENLAKAIECLQNALNLTFRLSNPFFWAEINNSLGNAYQHDGQYQKAIKYFENTLEIHTRNAFPTDYIKTKVNLANAHVKNGKLEESLKIYEEAIYTLEDLFYKLATDDDAKRKLGEEWLKIYQYIISVCLQLGKQNPEYYATAWEYVERSKARRLVEIFGQSKPNNVPDQIWKQFQDLRNQITHEEKWIEDKEKLIILSQDNLSEQSELDSKKANLNNLKQLLNQKLNDYPRLADTQRIQYTPFSKIGEKLSDDHTVIIQWHLLNVDQKFCAYIYTRQSFQPYVWESSLEDFESLQQWYQEYFLSYRQFILIIKNHQIFDSFEELKQTMISGLTPIEELPEGVLSTEKQRDFILNYVTNLKKPDQWIDELSDRLEQLAKILHIDELLNYLPKTCQQVILIPHRYLHLLPIHALPIKPETWKRFNSNSEPSRENYLFECFIKGIRYAPSCQNLLMLEKRSRPNFNQLFAMGNPTQDRAFTELCVKTVETIWKQKHQQSEPKVLCGQQATKNSLIHELKDYLKNTHTFLYSGHGSFDFESPLDSGLILHNNETLQLTEIFGLNLEQCRLVTLIGCETGMTDWTSITDEYIGLPSAFLWAEVSGIISSLWTVEEKASIILGIKLYQNLLDQTGGEKNVIEALQKAISWLRNVTKSELSKLSDWMYDHDLLPPELDDKLRLFLEQNDDFQPFSSPYYWAAFCIIGK